MGSNEPSVILGLCILYILEAEDGWRMEEGKGVSTECEVTWWKRKDHRKIRLTLVFATNDGDRHLNEGVKMS